MCDAIQRNAYTQSVNQHNIKPYICPVDKMHFPSGGGGGWEINKFFIS